MRYADAIALLLTGTIGSRRGPRLPLDLAVRISRSSCSALVCSGCRVPLLCWTSAPIFGAEWVAYAIDRNGVRTSSRAPLTRRVASGRGRVLHLSGSGIARSGTPEPQCIAVHRSRRDPPELYENASMRLEQMRPYKTICVHDSWHHVCFACFLRRRSLRRAFARLQPASWSARSTLQAARSA